MVGNVRMRFCVGANLKFRYDVTQEIEDAVKSIFDSLLVRSLAQLDKRESQSEEIRTYAGCVYVDKYGKKRIGDCMEKF